MLKNICRLTILSLLALVFAACNQNKVFELPADSVEGKQSFVYNNKIDILIVMDNSDSMLKHQQNISTQIQPLVDELVLRKLDFQLAVTTTDMGSGGQKGVFQGSPSVLTLKTPNLKQALSQTLLQGEAGSSYERGFYALQTALSYDYLGGLNSGFLRDDSFLMILVISDEEDKSADVSTTDLIEQLDQLRPPDLDGTKGWVMNFLGVLEVSGACRTFNDYAEVGYKYMEMVEASGGFMESICTADFKNAITNFRKKLLSYLVDFPLDSIPDPASIRVQVNGAVVPKDPVNGWIYIPEKNLVRFNGTSIPPADAKISISFQPISAS